MRSLVRGNGDLGRLGSDLGQLVANFSDRKSIEDTAHFMESCLELIGIENLVWFQETLTGTLIQSSQSDHKKHRTQKFQYRHSDQWKGSQPISTLMKNGSLKYEEEDITSMAKVLIGRGLVTQDPIVQKYPKVLIIQAKATGSGCNNIVTDEIMTIEKGQSFQLRSVIKSV